jgi:hypothetical protein
MTTTDHPERIEEGIIPFSGLQPGRFRKLNTDPGRVGWSR